ncbi:MAG: SGNH/GDSL hydrolase family protein, partial [Planctomycetota bacterium]
GFADDEFDLTRPVRIGYAGDSITRGVGCGYGYRYTELLERAYPDFLHANLGKSGAGIAADKEVDKVLALTDELGFTTVVCALNLNDCLPETYKGKDEAHTPMRRAKLFVKGTFDWLRPRSYLYNYVRTKVKNAFQVRNIDFHGYPSAELFPTRYADTIRQTASRVNRLKAGLDERGVELIVIIFPYEMQISEHAARVYADHGIRWEPEFLAGSTQDMLIEGLDDDIRCYDLLDAFIDPHAVEASRAAYEVGECFVHDQGDRLDWNHPNRKGHRLMAEHMIREGIFDHLASPSATAVPAGVPGR